MRRKKLWLMGVLAALAVMVSGCSVIPGMGGNDTGESHLGDTVSTLWFSYVVNSAEPMETYEGYTAAEGNKLVVVDLTLENTFNESVPMFDTDFQLYWGEYSDNEWALPLEVYCDAQLPAEYYLSIDETREGILVYEVPEDVRDFTFAFLEVKDNGTEEGEEGDLFVTYFTAA